jgi:hypothetical protein
MNPSLRAVIAGLALALAFAVPAGAQDAGKKLVDQGRLVTFERDVPVATERFRYTLEGDSLIVEASSERRRRNADGSQTPYTKNMVLIARTDDFGMLNYTSNEWLAGRKVTRSILPTDTLLTTYSEVDGHNGAADMLERPPGRIFALDQGMFTLFDVIGRNLQHRIFGSRPVQLVVLGEKSRCVQATATLAGPDTVTWGGRRVVTGRIALRDSTGAFTLWLSPEGHMLRLESADGRLVVMRDPPAPPPTKRPRPRPRAK